MRQPEPFFRKQTSSWYVQIDGRQINLGKDQKAAWAEYHALMAGRQEVSPNTTIAELAAIFDVSNKHGNKAERTRQWYKRHIDSFIDHAGARLKVRDLKPFHVSAWLRDRYKGSGANNKNGAVRAVKRLFKWAADEGHISSNPIGNVKPVPYEPREVCITRENWRRFVDSITSPAFLDLVLFMRATGCRPFEARTVEARHVDGDCIVFDRSESKSKRHRRVVPLFGTALEIVKRLAADSTGPLFRNGKGRPWTAYAMNLAFDRAEKKLGFDLFPYAVRHTYATEAIENGVDPITVATLMGHQSVNILMKVYQHVNKKGEHLRAAAKKAAG
jgi:integrase